MIKTKFCRKLSKRLKNYLTIKAIRKLGRQPNLLSWDQLLKKQSGVSSHSEKRHKSRTTEDKRLKRMDKKEESAQTLTFERIIHVFRKDKLLILVKWRETDKCSLIESTEANSRWPQEVIKYYEKRLIFAKEFTKEFTQN